MRDIALSIIVFGAIPFILARPYVGVLMWTWLGYFNPQKMTYGFALRMPFSEVVGGATILAWFFSSRESKKLPKSGVVFVWILFILWMGITTWFAQVPGAADTQLVKVLKIQIFSLLTVVMTNNWARVRQLVWCIVLSIGYFAVKGGIWVVRTGGASKVWGPAGTFIEGNNELALAILMTIPLAYFLLTTETVVWKRRALIVGIVLSGLSVAGSFSRGAVLAAAAMSMYLIWRSKSRFTVAAAVFLLAIGVVAFMPQSWENRVHTIETYQKDDSALKRLNAWQFAWNFAQDHPVLGGGYEIFQSQDAYQRYAPRSDAGWIFEDGHSIYLKILAEHGFPGLVLFLLVFATSWRTSSKTIEWSDAFAPDSPEHQINVLARTLQASMVAYAVGGAFLGLCYFDLPYNIAGLCVVLGTKAIRESVTTKAVRRVGARPSGAPGESLTTEVRRGARSAS